MTMGDRIMFKQVWEGTYGAAKTAQLIAPRGYFGTLLDGFAMQGWVVATSDLKPTKGCKGQLTISWEPGGVHAYMPLPCSDFRIEPMELYPRIERNLLFNQFDAGFTSYPNITLDMVGLCYQAVHAATAAAKKAAEQAVYSYSDSWQSDLGVVLLDKLRKGEETFYLGSMKFIWWYFSYTLPSLSMGAFIQWPGGPGSVPTALPSSMSFLRLADNMEPVGANGSMYKVTMTHLGGPLGHWDPDIYPS
jgi:hypothetical protein